MNEQAHARSKFPASPAAGSYGHPIHPALVGVPIGAWVASLVFDLASRFTVDTEVFVRGAMWLIALGILGGLIAAVFGLIDLVRLPRGTPAFRTGLLHAALNAILLALYATSFALRWAQFTAPKVPGALIALNVASLVLLVVTGWLGGTMVYRYGLRVVDEATQAEGFEKASPPEHPAGGLGPRQTQEA